VCFRGNVSSIWAVAKTIIPIDMHVVEDQRIRKKSPVDDKKTATKTTGNATTSNTTASLF